MVEVTIYWMNSKIDFEGNNQLKNSLFKAWKMLHFHENVEALHSYVTRIIQRAAPLE